MRRVCRLLMLVVLAACWIQATPLRLDYTKAFHGNGVAYYSFTLTLSNQDQTWAQGQGFNWVIFGDSPDLGGSVFRDFTLISSSGPWNQVTMTSGSHNGWLLGPTGQSWTPAAVGDFVTWHGYSTVDLPSGAIRFSVLSPVVTPFAAASDVTPGSSPPLTSFAASPPPPPPPPPPSTGSASTPPRGSVPLVVAPVATPEPSTFGLAGLALLALAWRAKR